MGEQLGGRPMGDEFYDEKATYCIIEWRKPHFFAKVSSVCERAVLSIGGDDVQRGGSSVCHRMLLISRVLADGGEVVSHIRGDGSLQSMRNCARDKVQTWPRDYSSKNLSRTHGNLYYRFYPKHSSPILWKNKARGHPTAARRAAQQQIAVGRLCQAR